MKKQLKILVLFFMVWAPLGAQTFEKIISNPSTFDQLHIMKVDDNDNINVFIKNIDYQALPFYGLGLKPTFTTIVQLDESGNQLKSKKITSNNFIPSLDSSITSFATHATYYENNKYLLSGLVRIDTPATFASIIYTLDSNLNIEKFHIQDTLVDEGSYFHRIRLFNNKYYGVGEVINLYSNRNWGHLAAIGDSLRFTRNNLYTAVDSIFLTRPNDFLIDDQHQFYIFGEGTLPNKRTISDMQLVKTDSNFSLIKSKYVSYPLHPNELSPLNFSISLSSFWISDTTFLLATTGPTGIDRTGDIHLFVYDTSLQQQNYKRIISPKNTIAHNVAYRTTVYDSVSDCFYMGSTRRFKGWNRFPFGTGDTTDFQLTKFDKNLNVLFQRNYRRDKTLAIYTLATDSKGNVIMGGITQEINYAHGYETDIFILKVDSLGNFNHSTGINQSSEIEELNYQIYPNPSQGKLSFIQYNLQETYEMKVYNSQGSLMGIYNFKNADNHFDISNFSNGVYVYTLKDSKGRTASGKIIKQD